MLLPNIDNTKHLLIIAEQRRQHLSYIVTALNGLMIPIIFGVLYFFLGGSIGSSPLVNLINNSTQSLTFSYGIFAIGAVTLLLALWRWYVRYLDDNICNLYPEIMLYEQILGTPKNMGIRGYLARQNNVIGDNLQKLWKPQQVQFIQQLVRDKRMGRRGHTTLDTIVFTVIGFAITLVVIDIYQLSLQDTLRELINFSNNQIIDFQLSKIFGYLMVAGSLVIHLITFLKYQRNPSNHYVHDTMTNLTLEYSSK